MFSFNNWYFFRAGILYPRGATVGGSSQINAMNVALPPANDWEYIAELTGDDSWHASEMRQHFIDLERNAFFPPGTPGHGFDGYVSVYVPRCMLKWSYSNKVPFHTEQFRQYITCA
jgi:choline dehydrogenase